MLATVARAAFTALVLAAAFDAYTNCCPSTDVRVWGPHAWTVAYHLAHRAEARGWSGERFSRVMDAMAATLPCHSCRRHYVAVRVDPEGLTPPELVHRRQAAVAAFPGSVATKWPGPMAASAAARGFGRSWRQYKCCATGSPMAPLIAFVDELAY